MPARDEKRGEQTEHKQRWPFIYTCILTIAGLIALPCIFWGFGYLLISTSSWRQQEPNTAIYSDGKLRISAPEMLEGKYNAVVVKGRPMSKSGALRKAGVLLKDGVMEYEGHAYQVLCQADIWVAGSSFEEYSGKGVHSTWAIDDLLDEESKGIIEGGDAAVVILTDKSAFYFLITK